MVLWTSNVSVRSTIFGGVELQFAQLPAPPLAAGTVARTLVFRPVLTQFAVLREFFDAVENVYRNDSMQALEAELLINPFYWQS